MIKKTGKVWSFIKVVPTRTSICIKSRLVSKNNISKTFVLQNKRGIIYLKMVYGYIRVSTDKQTVENQRFEIERFCKKEGLTIDGWIEETISGTKNYSKRALGKLLNRIVKDDLIICTELSRLGRNLFMIMEILNICMTKESRVWTIKDNYRLGDDIQSKVLAFAFGLSAEIERNLISQRTKEALARLKKEGHQVGRGQGQRNKQLNAKCVAKHKYIEGQMAKGISVPQIAKKLKIARGYTISIFGIYRIENSNKIKEWQMGAWYLLTVRFLKTDPKARYQGYTFYFREGLCWSDINTTFLKCRIKQKSIHDVKSMSIFGVCDKVPEKYILCVINSTLISYYVDTFVNNTQTFQINDARQLPIIVPTSEQLSFCSALAKAAIAQKIKGNESSNIQKQLDDFIENQIFGLV